MIGKDIDGGYAEYVVVPEQNAFHLPDEIPFTHGAVMMCSFATALHALRKARFTRGESVAIFGAGGLGAAAISIASALGASEIIAVDVNGAKVRSAESMGAFGINASDNNVLDSIFDRTSGQGVDVALELVGLPITTAQAVKSLGVQGRGVMVGLASEPTALPTTTTNVKRSVAPRRQSQQQPELAERSQRTPSRQPQQMNLPSRVAEPRQQPIAAAEASSALRKEVTV